MKVLDRQTALKRWMPRRSAVTGMSLIVSWLIIVTIIGTLTNFSLKYLQ